MTAQTDHSTATSPTPRTDGSPRIVRSGPPLLLWLGLGALMAILGLLVGLYLGGAAYQPEPAGIPDPGPVVGWGLPLSKLFMIVSGTLTLGFLTSAAFLQPSADGVLVSRAGRRDLVTASVTSLVWSASCLATLVFTHATALGKPLAEALRPDLVSAYAFEITQNIAFAFTAFVALLISIFALLAARTSWAAVLLGGAAIALVMPPINAHGTSLGDHSLAMTAGALHALAAALWVGGLIVMAVHALRRDPDLAVAIRRFSTLATGCVVVLLLSGIGNAYARLEQPSDLFTSGYGVLVVLKIVLLGVVVLVATRSRRAVAADDLRRTQILRWLLIEGLLLAMTIGVAVSLTLTGYPRADVILPTPGEQILGYPFPPEPTLSTVGWGWYPDVFFLALAAVLAGVYAVGLVAVHRRGVRWFVGRAICWYFGVALLVWATSGGIAAYAEVSFEWHMVAHMALSMLVPILLVLGMPVTLALRALKSHHGGDRGPREWLVTFLNSGIAKFYAHPLVALFIATIGLYALYFTSLFPTLMSTHLGHLLMTLHFLFSGLLVYWIVLGLDPGPRQVPPWARMMLLLVYISLHAFFAVGVMMMTQPLGAEWFGSVQPPWIVDPLRDTSDGGSVAWAFGEIPALIVMLVVAVQWARSDARIARRLDRQADRDGDAELRAYNERLAKMAERADSEN